MLDEYLQKFADILEMERENSWEKGDIIAECIRRYGKDVIGKFAEVGRVSKQTIKVYALVSLVFPQDKRYPDVAWSLYRAVYFKAKKLNMDPIELLEFALQNNMTARDVMRYKSEPKIQNMKRFCPACDIEVEIKGNIKEGSTIYCPICRRDIGVVFLEEHLF